MGPGAVRFEGRTSAKNTLQQWQCLDDQPEKISKQGIDS